tara:strand:- start:1050 stop:1307 length:258 start_codon:yes stop_codon:yes gene_type:complete
MLRAPKSSSPNNNNTNARRSKRMPSVDVGTTGRKMHFSRFVDFEASHFECKMSFCREKRRERKMVGIEGTTTKKKKRRDDIESDY